MLLFLANISSLAAQESQGPIRDSIGRTGAAEVIVIYKSEGETGTSAYSGFSDSGKFVAQSLQLDADQSGAVRSIGSGNAAVVTVDGQGLDKLLADERVELVSPINTYEPALIESSQLVGVGDFFTANPQILQQATAGTQPADKPTVAVIDTGVDSSHPFLSGKVVLQACFSENFPAKGITSLCVGGQDDGGYVTDLSANSAPSCVSSISGCGHGNHIAGIIAGNPVPDPRNARRAISGIDPLVSIAAIQVYSKYENSIDCSSSFPAPCAKTSDPALIRALEYIQFIELQRRIMKIGPRIVAVNMSLASGRRTTPCDTTSPLTRSINNLRGLGIPTFIASGNHGDVLGVAEPGCISTAFTVAASTKVGKIWTKSNRSTVGLIDAVAPGVGIYSSFNDGTFHEESGTSMATAVAAGVFAILSQRFPDRSSQDIELALKQGGHLIADDASGFQFPFIDAMASFKVLRDHTQLVTNDDNGSATPTGILVENATSDRLLIELKPSSKSANDVLKDIEANSVAIFGQEASQDIEMRALGQSNIAIDSKEPLSLEGLAGALERSKIEGIGAVFSSKTHNPF